MPEHDFSITTQHIDGCLMITVHGDLDAINAELLEQTLSRSQDGLPVIVDLAAVTFICSASLHVLLKPRAGAQAILVAPNRNIAKVLDIVEADRTTAIFLDREAALASLDTILKVAS